MAKAKAEKPVNTEMIVKANSAMTIASEIMGIVGHIIENGGECDDNTLAMLQNWQAALEVKASNIGLVKARLEADIEYYKIIEESARSRRKTTENTIEKLKKYLRDCMQAAEMRSIKGDLFSFSLVEGRIRPVIDNENALPFDFVSVVEVIRPKSDEIKKALEAGAEIPGAHLERGEDYVMIRAAGKKTQEEAE